MNAIEANNLSVRYKIPHEKKTTVFENILSWIKGGRFSYEELWALKDVSFTVEEGEMLGIIGENGSGKTTLLSVIGNMVKPDDGSCITKGKIAPFLGLGVGFQGDLSAKENIYIYGSIMGLTNKEISLRLDEIIKFAELEKFRDTKLKNFSSGMLTRLGFAIAINVNADILLIDEVLAVGDESFQRKCLSILQNIRKQNKTILFVTHSLEQVVSFCDRAILLHQGTIVKDGFPKEVVNQYLASIKMKEGKERQEETKNFPEVAPLAQEEKKVDFLGGVKIEEVDFLDNSGTKKSNFKTGEKFIARIQYFSEDRIKNPVFGIGIDKKDGTRIYGPSTKDDKVSIDYIEGRGEFEYIIDSLPLLESEYLFNVTIHSYESKYIVYASSHGEFTFRVAGARDGKEGVVHIPGRWKTNY